jgi:hypothetical protein
VVTPADLRQTAVADVPAAILARYTELPDSIPERVHDLAREVAGDFPNPYDQARALERFLRQYPYSLDVTLPPSGADPVDYFLFELQAGYCDYYASSMVVMARSLGLPARLVIGFLAQPPDEAGVQTVRHINGHSWAEIYFADYGWIEFEPTASFNSPFENPFSTGFILDPSDFIDDPMLQSGDLPTIPEPSPDMTPFPWGRVGLVAALVLPLYWLWRRQQKGAVGRDYVLWAFGRVQHSAQKLGQPTRPSQTPLEFTTTFLRYLETFIGQRPFMQRRLTDILQTIRPAVEQLTTLFIQRQYAGMKQYGELSAHQLWRRLRRPLWFLRFLNLFRK